jgi:diadenylate cyclase
MAATRLEQLDRTYGSICERVHCSSERRRTLEEVIQLAVEIAREGREGRKIGTLFVVGNVEDVLAQSRPLLLDPLFGHPPDVLHVDRTDLRETVKELAQLDGAFLVGDDGTFVAAGRYIDVDLADPTNFVAGLGTRHAAGASISKTTGAIAVVVSQSSIVRVYAKGRVKAEIIPELFLLSREHLFVPSAEIRAMPDVGLTLAVSGED